MTNEYGESSRTARHKRETARQERETPGDTLENSRQEVDTTKTTYEETISKRWATKRVRCDRLGDGENAKRTERPDTLTIGARILDTKHIGRTRSDT